MDAKTRVVALIGRPVGHSLSPVMQNAAFAASGLNYVYLAFDVDDAGKALDAVRSLGIAGLNVTMPHKAAVIEHLDRVDAWAASIGAVNVVVNRNGVLEGYNTDSSAAASCLEKRIQLAGKRILLLGCGGAGRAIAFALKEKKAELFLFDRKAEKAAGLAASLNAQVVRRDEFGSINFDVLINATPVGMHPKKSGMPVATALLRKELLVFDIVYSPIETRLLREAKKRGCGTVSGLEMLLEQGVASFELWTGRKAPRKAMENALRKAIAGRAAK